MINTPYEPRDDEVFQDMQPQFSICRDMKKENVWCKLMESLDKNPYELIK